MTTNRKQANKKKTKPKKRNGVTTVQRVYSGSAPPKPSSRYLYQLDDIAKAHARLLADPCTAPLTYGVYPGAGGGIVVRVVQDLILFNGFPTETHGAFVWCPAYSSYVVNNLLTPLTSDTQIFKWTDLKPGAGNAVLSAATSYRCLAGCVQAYYPGTELTRSGFVGMGYTNGGTIGEHQDPSVGGDGHFTSVGVQRQSQFHTERTPAQVIELKWKPNQSDEQFFNDISQANQTATNSFGLAGKSCITLTASGLPPGVGLRVKCTAIYEYIVQPGSGIVGTAGTARRSQNTTNQVLNALDSAGNWFLTKAHDYGREVMSGMAASAVTMLAI